MSPNAQAVVRYTLATHAAENMKPGRKALRLCEQIANGQITADHAVEEIKRSYGIREPNDHG